MHLRADMFLALPILNQITLVYSSTAVTLIYTEHKAVLVDALTTTAQASALADWIDKRLTHHARTRSSFLWALDVEVAVSGGCCGCDGEGVDAGIANDS